MTATPPKPSPREPTVAEAMTLINKMDACTGMAAKLILLRNFLTLAGLADETAPKGEMK